MKIYANQKSGVTVVDGVVTSIAPDRLSVDVKSQKWDVAAQKMQDQTIAVGVQVPLEENISVGQKLAVVGFMHPTLGFQAMDIMAGNRGKCFDVAGSSGLSVVHGEVTSAGWNDQKNPDGTQRLKADGTPRKPCYVLRVNTYEPDPASTTGEVRRVLHTISVYNFTQKDGTVNTDQVDRLRKNFDNYNRKENPATITIVTNSGEVYGKEGKDRDGNPTTNFYCNHLGYKSINIEFEKERTMNRTTQAAPAQEAPAASAAQAAPAAPAPAAPAPSAPQQDPAGNGFEETEPYEPQDVDPSEVFL